MSKENTEIFKKGFHSILTDVRADNSIKTVLKRLEYLKINKKKYNLGDSDNAIIGKILNSYYKLINKHPLKIDDLILEDFEIVELEKISDLNLARYLIYRYKYNIYPKMHIAEDYPPCIQIEPSSICNFRCTMCFHIDESFSGKKNGYMGLMPIDIFKKSVDQVEGHVEAVTFASRGEPTANKDLPDMLKYCEGKFLGLKINTNASMLNEKLIHSILSSDLQTIVFSVDARNKLEYEQIRVNGKFEKIERNIEMFNEIRNKHYSRDEKIVRISGVKINKNQDVDDMKDKWGDLVDSVAFVNFIPWNASYINSNSTNNITSPCSELWLRMFVWYDGKVNPCDYDYKSKLSRWNINESTINEIWTSDEYAEYRNTHLQGKRSTLDPCNGCISR